MRMLRNTLLAACGVLALAGAASAQILYQGNVATNDTTRTWPQGSVYITMGAVNMTATGASPVLKASGSTVVLQLDGSSCTSLSGQLQRSALDPAGGTTSVYNVASTGGGNYVQNVPYPAGGSWAPVGSAQSAVNPSTGVAPVTTSEPAVGWYRYNVTSITGTCNVTLGGSTK